MWSSAPRTTLCGGPEPRFEPRTGGLETGVLAPRPPHLLFTKYLKIFAQGTILWECLPPECSSKLIKVTVAKPEPQPESFFQWSRSQNRKGGSKVNKPRAKLFFNILFFSFSIFYKSGLKKSYHYLRLVLEPKPDTDPGAEARARNMSQPIRDRPASQLWF